jgi:hypothetical protein
MLGQSVGNIYVVGTDFINAHLKELSKKLDLKDHLVYDFSISGATANGNINNSQSGNLFHMIGSDGFDQQTARVGEMDPKDVVFYGVVGLNDIGPMLSLELIMIDRAMNQFVEVHIKNIQSLATKGCKRLVLIYGAETDPELQSMFDLLFDGKNGLFKQFPKNLEITLLSIKDLNDESLLASIVL